ncbi:hypothetical protein BDW42DRAFT_179006 [Aspergillus taichungensis]|uniref:Uncharacterized protein n=1 Tax=Aspergillus taichungensis TaxID=482145 RepID=A0A2J5HH99_9EURO|nr:hypothetical protein BDW42DRAFT_179006 [Aspergillus taichungensis]
MPHRLDDAPYLFWFLILLGFPTLLIQSFPPSSCGSISASHVNSSILLDARAAAGNCSRK